MFERVRERLAEIISPNGHFRGNGAEMAKATIATQTVQPVAGQAVSARELEGETAVLAGRGREVAQQLQASAQQLRWGLAGQPIEPIGGLHGPVEEPLVFDYPPGVNLIAQPRSGFGLLSFRQLRDLADWCQELRLPIELMKREIRALEWDVVARSREERRRPSGETKRAIETARGRLESPDGLVTFDSWTNTLMGDLLEIDAATIYPVWSRSGDLLDAEVVDGTTIRPLLDARGQVPRMPVPAYAQTIMGVPVGYWNRDQLWYLPFNTRTDSPYGIPPGEMVLLTVNTALRRAGYQLAYFTDGNVPEALVGLPEMTVDQIAAYQEYFDALLAGDAQKLRRIKFMPVKTGGTLPVHEFKRPSDKVELDEWLLRVGCWAVGVSPSEFGLAPGGGLGGKGYSEGQADVQYRMGLGPIAQYLAGICNRMLVGWGWGNLVFRWVSLQRREDALRQAQVDQIYVMTGIRDREDIATERGWEAAPSLLDVPAVNENELRAPGRGEYMKRRGFDNPLGTSELAKAAAGIDMDVPVPDEVPGYVAGEQAIRESVLAAGRRVDVGALLAEIGRRVEAGEPVSEEMIEAAARAIAEAHGEELRVLIPGLVDLSEAGVEVGGAAFASATNILLDWSLANVEAATWARQYGFDLIGGLADESYRQIANQMATWVEAGETYLDLVRRINGVLQNPGRAQTVAETEATRVYAQGNRASWRQAEAELGVRIIQIWNTAVTDVCEFCKALDGKEVALDGEFFEEIPAPPRHVRCRCWLSGRVVFLY